MCHVEKHKAKYNLKTAEVLKCNSSQAKLKMLEGPEKGEEKKLLYTQLVVVKEPEGEEAVPPSIPGAAPLPAPAAAPVVAPAAAATESAAETSCKDLFGDLGLY